MDQTQDRRSHKRFKVLSGVFAVNSKFGQIIDISLGGISFRYIDKKRMPPNTEERGFLFSDDDLCLDNIPLRTISDQVVDGGVSTEATIVRRRSLEFGVLTPKQQNLLEHFIWVNTTGEIAAASAS